MEVFDIYWSNYERKFSFIIGHLYYDGTWIFKYSADARKAILLGFRPFPDMNDLDVVYKSDNLFSVFRMRYSQNADQILDIMKRSQGDLVTDKVLIKHVKRPITERVG